MDILIFGGTGTMGRYLVNYLSQIPDNQIYITTRQEKKSDKDNIHYVQGNAHDLDFLNTLLNRDLKWDAIIDFMIYSTEEFKNKRDIFLNGTKQYVFLSSSRVYANSKEPITEKSNRLLDVVEDEAFLSSDKYAISKAREENLLRESGKKNWTIIRPYITYSNIRFQLGVYEKEDWLYRVLHGRSVVFSTDISEKNTSFTYGADVSMGIAAIIGKEEAYGERFHITCEEKIKWSDVVETYKDILSREGYSFKIVYTEQAADIVNQEEKVKYDRIYNRVFDNSKIGKYVDVSTFKGHREGLNECLDEFLHNPSFKEINWTTQARMDRFLKEKTPLSEINSIKGKLKYIIFRYVVNYKNIERKKIFILLKKI